MLQLKFQLTAYENFISLFDGICDQTKEIQTLYGSMANDVKWIITSSGRYMFVRFAVDSSSSIGFLAKIHYGNEILNKKLVQRGNRITVSICFYKCSNVKTDKQYSKSKNPIWPYILPDTSIK